MSKDAGSGKAWIVAVSMGYGHQRTAYPLRYLSPDGNFINANDYEGIPLKDKEIWETSRRFYEFISKFKRLPVIGTFAFYVYDRFQRILSFYPKRDLSKPNSNVKEMANLIKKGWGKDLVERLKVKPLPLLSTFFIPAFMAEEFDYKHDVYCVTADADVARAWAPYHPQRSKVKYCASTLRVAERLRLYGVKGENIILTGYPLPKENIGSEKEMEIAKHDTAERLVKLDPNGTYRKEYAPMIEKYLGNLPREVGRPLTVLFSVGGAGAQKELGMKIVRSLKNDIQSKKVRIVLGAGIRREVSDYFEKELDSIKLLGHVDGGIHILKAIDLTDYFRIFNEALRTTDILWTKPSELSFYSALGLPIIIAPTIGSQEEFNRQWLLKLGAAMDQYNPVYTSEWLMDYWSEGWFAEAAMHGFVEGEKLGTYKIEKLLSR